MQFTLGAKRLHFQHSAHNYQKSQLISGGYTICRRELPYLNKNVKCYILTRSQQPHERGTSRTALAYSYAKIIFVAVVPCAVVSKCLSPSGKSALGAPQSNGGAWCLSALHCSYRVIVVAQTSSVSSEIYQALFRHL